MKYLIKLLQIPHLESSQPVNIACTEDFQTIALKGSKPTWQCFQDVKPPMLSLSLALSISLSHSHTLDHDLRGLLRSVSLPPFLGLLLGLLLVLGLFLEEGGRPQPRPLLLLLLGRRHNGGVGVGGLRRVALAVGERPRAVRVVAVVGVVACNDKGEVQVESNLMCLGSSINEIHATSTLGNNSTSPPPQGGRHLWMVLMVQFRSHQMS